MINEKEKVSKYYTVNGTNDWCRNIITSTSLTALMERCSDFVNEKTLLQVNLSKLGIEVHQSPKCHSELAREEIEYSWRFANNYYRQLPLKLKRKKEIFQSSVQSTMSQERITKQIVRKIVRRERGYTCTYHALAFGNRTNVQCEKISPDLIKKLVKLLKMHRCALDFEGKYIINIEKEESSSKSNSANSPKQVA